MNTLTDCITHGTSLETYLAGFVSTAAALADLEKCYRINLDAEGEMVDETKLAEMRNNARRELQAAEK